MNLVILHPNMTGEERLDTIMKIKPALGIEITVFVSENPEFYPFLKYCPSTAHAAIPKECTTVKNMLLYYACMAGVRADYGIQLWNKLLLKNMSMFTATKLATIQSIQRLEEITTLEQLAKAQAIKGVGEGAISFVKEHYFHDTNIIYPTDRVAQKGLAKIYKLTKPTVKQCKEIMEKWKGNKLIGTAFCFQVAHYAN